MFNHFGRLWVRPWIARRNQYGVYHALVQALSSEDSSGLKNFLRMDMATFNELIEMVTSVPLTKYRDDNVFIVRILHFGGNNL
jgi:hypothetical protein